MPRVPVYQQQVSVQPVPNVRLEAGNAGLAGQIMGEAVQRAGQNLAEAADILWHRAEELKQEQDRTKALEIATSFRKEKIAYLTDPEKGVLNLKGAATRGLYQRGSEELKALGERYLSQAENPEQRAMLEQALLSEVTQAIEDLSRHEAAELQAYRADATKEFVEASVQDAIASPSDEKIGRNLGQIRSSLAALLGLPETDPVVEGQVRKVASNIHAMVVKNFLDQGNPAGAKEYFESHVEGVLPEDRGTLSAAIRRGFEQKEQDELPGFADENARAVLEVAPWDQDDRGLEIIRGRTDLSPNQRLAVESRYKTLVSDQKRAQFEAQVAAVGEEIFRRYGWENLDQSRADIRAGTWTQEQKDALISYVEGRAREEAQKFADTTAPVIAQGIAKAFDYHRMSDGLAQVDALEGLGQAAKDMVKSELKSLWAMQESAYNQEQQDLYDATYAAVRQARSYAEATSIVQKSGLKPQVQDGLLAHARQAFGVGGKQESDWRTEVEIRSRLADGSLIKEFPTVWRFLEKYGSKLSDADKVTYAGMYESEQHAKDGKRQPGENAVTFSRASAITKLAKEAKITETGELARLFDYVNRVVAAKEINLKRNLDEAEFTDTVEWALEKTVVEKRSALGVDWLAPDKAMPRYQINLPPNATWNAKLNKWTYVGGDGKLHIVEFKD